MAWRYRHAQEKKKPGIGCVEKDMSEEFDAARSFIPNQNEGRHC
jgi:hypothetical protein